MKNDLKLDFNCPIDIKGMPKCDGGYACQQCKKPVFDYSKMNLDDFEKNAIENKSISQCGIYKAYHLAGSYGDWRDQVTKIYRSSIRKAQKKKRYLAILPFIAGFMFMTGCGSRHVCGGYSDWSDAPVNSDTTAQQDAQITDGLLK